MLTEKVWCAIQQKFMKGVIEIAIHDKFDWPANSKYPCSEGKPKILCKVPFNFHSIERSEFNLLHISWCELFISFSIKIFPRSYFSTLYIITTRKIQNPSNKNIVRLCGWKANSKLYSCCMVLVTIMLKILISHVVRFFLLLCSLPGAKLFNIAS